MRALLIVILAIPISTFAAGSESPVELVEVSSGDISALKQGSFELSVKSSQLPVDRRKAIHPVYAALRSEYKLAANQQTFCGEFKVDELTNKAEVEKKLGRIRSYRRGDVLTALSNSGSLGDVPLTLTARNAINLDLVKRNRFSKDDHYTCLFERQKTDVELAMDSEHYFGSDGAGGISVNLAGEPSPQTKNEADAPSQATEERTVPMTIFEWPPHPPRAFCKPANKGEKCSIVIEQGVKRVFDLKF